MKQSDFIVEIQTEELPPKSLLKLGHAFAEKINEHAQKANLKFADVSFYATPRRLAVAIKNLSDGQEDQLIERKGPSVKAAFDESGQPTKACAGFLKSLNIEAKDLIVLKTSQGEWVGFNQLVKGKTINEVMPDIVNKALSELPIAKRMRWGDGDTQFVRPVHGVLMLYGDQVIDALILAKQTSRVTRGHRFLAKGVVTIPTADAYLSLLATEGKVIADFEKRRDDIVTLANKAAREKLGNEVVVCLSPDLLDEVTGLVEWPVALCGHFDDVYLELPQEVLISAMQDHQRYFPVTTKTGKLLPYFIAISNIQTTEVARVTHGNERVLRARLSDAAFFYRDDQKQKLESRLDRLTGIIFQAKLGTLYEKSERLALLSGFIAKMIGVNREHAARAGLLAKCDLTTSMVNEFPELQGTMGFYYAEKDGEHRDVATAIKEHYLPRFSGDLLPKNHVGQTLALADRIDTLIGTFGINEIPTGDKDPFGLRRAALGVLRILIENKIHLDLNAVLEFAANAYSVKLQNNDAVKAVFVFLQERMKSYYLDKGVTPDVFAAVYALNLADPLDMDARIAAVSAFKSRKEAEMLSMANKRVSNILAKYDGATDNLHIDKTIFENAAEANLVSAIDEKQAAIAKFTHQRHYEKILSELATLEAPIDAFFTDVMVMADDPQKRDNRIAILAKLRSLFLQVADIALLQ